MNKYLLMDMNTDRFKTYTRPIDAIIYADADRDEVEAVIDEVRSTVEDWTGEDVEEAICNKGWEIEWIDDGTLVFW